MASLSSCRSLRIPTGAPFRNSVNLKQSPIGNTYSYEIDSTIRHDPENLDRFYKVMYTLRQRNKYSPSSSTINICEGTTENNGDTKKC